MPEDPLNTLDKWREHLATIRNQLSDAQAGMHQAILDALAAGKGPSEVARRSGYSREWVARIRDGKKNAGT